MKILIVEPFFTGSHKSWALGFQAHSGHEVAILSLPGRNWKWRMHGGAVTLARMYEAQNLRPDLILASDMLDLGIFLALIKKNRPPAFLYMHENQLVYPWSPNDPGPSRKQDTHFCFINYTSALVAEKVFFNSNWHKKSFLAALPDFLAQFPDYQEKESVSLIAEKSTVLQPGLSLSPLLNEKQTVKPGNFPQQPLIIWNHRWEYDKNPADFFEALKSLKGNKLNFQLAVLGENFRKFPPVFEEARTCFSKEIVHWGYVKSEIEYHNWLLRGDLLPVTSNQDFFGISTIEAMAAGCFPLLPDRLAFPEHIPEGEQSAHLYRSREELIQKMENYVKNYRPEEKEMQAAKIQSWVRRYDWERMIITYDDSLDIHIS